jgi:hypothetical protein
MTYLEHLDFMRQVAAVHHLVQVALVGQVLVAEVLATVQLAAVLGPVEVHRAGTQFTMVPAAAADGTTAAVAEALGIKVLLFCAIKRNYVR